MEIQPPARAAYVLAGGKSSRMGRDKSMLSWRGITLLERACREASKVCEAVFVIGGAGQGRIPDLYPGEGPLGGILTALRHTRAEWNLILACDMPLLDAANIAPLFALAAGSLCAIPVHADGGTQPLCAVYHRGALGALQARFDAGMRRAADAAASLQPARYLIPRANFANINTPAEWHALAG